MSDQRNWAKALLQARPYEKDQSPAMLWLTKLAEVTMDEPEHNDDPVLMSVVHMIVGYEPLMYTEDGYQECAFCELSVLNGEVVAPDQAYLQHDKECLWRQLVEAVKNA